jgi:GNAT superfamily N-acetyltransferase
MPSFALITSLQDDLLLPWLDLYETAFPFAERVPVSLLLGMLKEKKEDFHMLAALDEEDAFAGLAFYILPATANGRAGFLWYLATRPDLRGQGLGAWMYRGVLARLPRSVEALYYDVEIPALAESPEGQNLARRRIRFYQRLGARVLTGITDQMRAAPDRPLLSLHLMVHPRVELTPQAAYDLASIFLPDELLVTGKLGYE